MDCCPNLIPTKQIALITSSPVSMWSGLLTRYVLPFSMTYSLCTVTSQDFNLKMSMAALTIGPVWRGLGERSGQVEEGLMMHGEERWGESTETVDKYRQFSMKTENLHTLYDLKSENNWTQEGTVLLKENLHMGKLYLVIYPPAPLCEPR